jgi:prevent-host-death family protein
METNIMTKSINALTARTNFGKLMDQVENQRSRFLVNKRGVPKVVILSVDDYLKNILKKPTLLAEIQQDAKKAGLDKMTDDEIQAEIDAYRKSIKN